MEGSKSNGICGSLGCSVKQCSALFFPWSFFFSLKKIQIFKHFLCIMNWCIYVVCIKCIHSLYYKDGISYINCMYKNSINCIQMLCKLCMQYKMISKNIIGELRQTDGKCSFNEMGNNHLSL